MEKKKGLTKILELIEILKASAIELGEKAKDIVDKAEEVSTIEKNMVAEIRAINLSKARDKEPDVFQLIDLKKEMKEYNRCLNSGQDLEIELRGLVSDLDSLIDTIQDECCYLDLFNYED